jgi:uncharacterized protein (TIGR02611 family)
VAADEAAVKDAVSRRERTLARIRERKETHKRRGRVYRISFAVLGTTLILIGLVLIPLPGPGWLIVAIGVGMLALEFDRAERLLERILEKLENVADVASDAPLWQKVIGAGLAALATAAGIAAILLWEIPYLPG